MSATFESQVQAKQLPPPQQSPLSKPPMHGAGPTGTPKPISMAQNTNQQVPYMNNAFANANSATSSPPKAAQVFIQSYQNQMPQQHHNIPVTQSLPASQAVQPAVVPPVSTSDDKEKPQSNGTSEVKTSSSEQKDNKEKENHVSTQKNNAAGPIKDNEKTVPEPAAVPAVAEASMISSSVVVTSTVPAAKPCESKEAISVPSKPSNSALASEADGSTTSPATGAKKVAVDSITESSSNVDTTSSTTDTKTKDTPPARDEKPESKKREAVDGPVTTTTPDTDGKVGEAKQEVQSSTQAEQASPPVTSQKPKDQTSPAKSPMKVATTPRTPPQRKVRTPRSEPESPRTSSQKSQGSTSDAKASKSPSSASGRTKRARMRTQHYQSPLPELEIISKISQNTTPKSNETRLIVFYKQEFLAVRNAEGSFFVCQAVQNVYKNSARIKIRWLSQDKNEKSGEIYTPDFYDSIDFECILTNLDLTRVEKGKFRLPPKEKERTDNILKKAIAVEKGEAISLDDSMTEDNPDGLDVSLYTEEDQLVKKRGPKRKHSKGRPASTSTSPSPSKRVAVAKAAKTTPKTKTKKKPATPASEPPKKSTAAGRSERAKRRSALEGTKSSPVIDNKKAKVLAKVVKRTAAPAATTKSAAATPNKTSKAKVAETKATKQPVASTSKVKTPKAASTPTTAPTRKTPKRGRK